MGPTADHASSVAGALRRWSLANPRLIADTATSRVFKVDQPSGELAVLKVLKPDGAEEARGFPLMRWYGGDGAVGVLAADDTTILMEWLDGATLGDMVRGGNDEGATDVLCDVVSKLHRKRLAPTPARLLTLAGRFAPLFTTDPAFFPSSHRALVAQGIAIALDLLDDGPDPIPLHGDFHHDNVVGSQRGWLVIDAKGVIGDPAYEVSNVFRNPEGAEMLAMRPDRIDRLAAKFATKLGLEPKRVLGWAVAHCALSACWDHEAGMPLEWNMRMLHPLLSAHERA